ncbi:hypothetical protein SAMN04489867_1420 [Pedococcus dokdonensis]|uniref:Uncharacterized protein n=1 Tax=Pedococcus dokdonensis TaxID=443156 RepID=A0A1H0Q0H6_9MICO|nr:hypothetical protein [Pedococcus dokdonensis]SDP10188.1 hypothetical protein SAMN04489867_1420 [Pedococcus dokdonensis]
MTRPKLIVGVLAAACVGTLLWYAWLIVSADLPRGARIASWSLWLVATTAALTLYAYLREFLGHRAAVGREASWKPLPGLVLLWLAGATAMLSIGFVLPDKAAGPGATSTETASTSLTSQTVDSESESAAATARASTPASRSSVSRTSAPTPVTTTSPSAATPTADRSTSTSSAPSSSTKRTGKPTTPPGKPTPSTTTTPLIGITLPAPG